MESKKSKKRFPSQELYRLLHAFFNKEATEFPGNKYGFEDTMIEMGYQFVTDKRKGEYVIRPDGQESYSSRHIHQVRFSEVIEDIDKRLKEHGYSWSVKQGQKKATTYGYQEPVPYNFPEECKMDKTLNDIELLKDIIGFTRTSFSNKKVERDIISFTSIGMLDDIELVKEIYLAIRDRKVVEFTYHAAHSNHPKHFVLSPHYLKQYNQRWFLFGYVESVSDPNNVKLNADSYPREGHYTFAVDRMDENFMLRTDLKYHQPQTINYSTFFNDIVGITHFTDRPMKPVDITITTYSRYIHQLLMANPVHSSQVEEKPCVSKKEPGKIRLHVCVNQELERILLGFGENIKVEWKGPSYKAFLRRISNLNKLYQE